MPIAPPGGCILHRSQYSCLVLCRHAAFTAEDEASEEQRKELAESSRPGDIWERVIDGRAFEMRTVSRDWKDGKPLPVLQLKIRPVVGGVSERGRKGIFGNGWWLSSDALARNYRPREIVMRGPIVPQEV